MNDRLRAAAVINRHFQNGKTNCWYLSKRLPDNRTTFPVEATAITPALDYYRHMDPIWYDVVVYSDSMSCLQAIEREDNDNPHICHIMKLRRVLSDKCTCVRFYWIFRHWVRWKSKPTSQRDPWSRHRPISCTDLKPLINSNIQLLVHIKWVVS